ncbi:divalent-cation tolerance protein CutA [Cerasicoccus frondis]|uniref:divalent-cation tolerance protein CutA n=1 Tax=Cerasicoccus frondis TaxID=490090 RepID=UPI002852D556|nr:divalent-cation tolerance protein CutA [Cerasicoccus frondis]
MLTPEPIAIGWSTTPSRELAEQIGRALVEKRLVACAQITGPVTSIYRWQGEICQEEEFRLVLKFSAAREKAVHEALVTLHPYDTPQWIVTHADAGSSNYVAWVHDSQHEDAP